MSIENNNLILPGDFVTIDAETFLYESSMLNIHTDDIDKISTPDLFFVLSTTKEMVLITGLIRSSVALGWVFKHDVNRYT